MTGFFLLDHDCRIPQWRTPRRAPLSGVVGVHTAEGVMDDVDIDTGAENVAAFIVNRSDFGSYHEIVDSDSLVRCAPDDYETWHIGADLMNWHSWGISAACRSTEWDPDGWWTQQTITRMGQQICAFWRRNGFDPIVCARELTREQALAKVPGWVLHGVMQTDRTDAWEIHPRRATLSAMLNMAILIANGQPQEESSMVGRFWRNPVDGETNYVGAAGYLGPGCEAVAGPCKGGMYRFFIVNPTDLRLIKPDDEVITDATSEEWARIVELPLINQA